MVWLYHLLGNKSEKKNNSFCQMAWQREFAEFVDKRNQGISALFIFFLYPSHSALWVGPCQAELAALRTAPYIIRELPTPLAFPLHSRARTPHHHPAAPPPPPPPSAR